MKFMSRVLCALALSVLCLAATHAEEPENQNVIPGWSMPEPDRNTNLGRRFFLTRLGFVRAPDPLATDVFAVIAADRVANRCGSFLDPISATAMITAQIRMTVTMTQGVMEGFVADGRGLTRDQVTAGELAMPFFALGGFTLLVNQYVDAQIADDCSSRSTRRLRLQIQRHILVRTQAKLGLFTFTGNQPPSSLNCDPESVQCLIEYGRRQFHIAMNDWDAVYSGQAAMEDVIGFNPQNWVGWFRAFRTYGVPESALPAIPTVQPHHARTGRFMRGQLLILYCHAGGYQSACNDLADHIASLQRSQNERIAYRNILQLNPMFIAAGRLDIAEANFEAAAAALSEDHFIFYMPVLAAALLEEERFDDGIAMATRYIEYSNEDFHRSYSGAGLSDVFEILYQRRDRFSRSEVDEILREVRDERIIQNATLSSFASVEDLERADEFFEQALTGDPYLAPYRAARIIRFYARMHDRERYDEAMRRFPRTQEQRTIVFAQLAGARYFGLDRLIPRASRRIDRYSSRVIRAIDESHSAVAVAYLGTGNVAAAWDELAKVSSPGIRLSTSWTLAGPTLLGSDGYEG